MARNYFGKRTAATTSSTSCNFEGDLGVTLAVPKTCLEPIFMKSIARLLACAVATFGLNQAHAQSFVNATNLLPDTYNSGG